MTTTFLASVDNDFTLNDRGELSLVTGVEAIGSDARSAIQAQRGEMVLALTEGMPTMETAWIGWRPMMFEAAARDVLTSVPGVLSVPELTVQRVGGALVYHATIRTDLGMVAIDA